MSYKLVQIDGWHCKVPRRGFPRLRLAMTVKVGSLKGWNPFKNPLPLMQRIHLPIMERGTQGVRLIKMIKIVTEAIQRVRGEIASPLARNDNKGGNVSLII